MLDSVKARTLAYCGHTMKKKEVALREMMQETMPRAAGEEDHARPWWTTSKGGQDSACKSQSERQRTEINGESMFMVWPTLGPRTAKDQNRRWKKSAAGALVTMVDSSVHAADCSAEMSLSATEMTEGMTSASSVPSTADNSWNLQSKFLPKLSPPSQARHLGDL